jgi:hypothetical protein
VPALVLLGGLPMATAVGTSLVVIAMKSAAGLAGYLASVQLDWGLALGVTAAAIAGTLVGNRLVSRIPQDVLRRIFGWFVVAMAIVVLGQQLGPSLPWPGATGIVIGLGVLGTVVAGTVDLRRQAVRPPSRPGPSRTTHEHEERAA